MEDGLPVVIPLARQGDPMRPMTMKETKIRKGLLAAVVLGYALSLINFFIASSASKASGTPMILSSTVGPVLLAVVLMTVALIVFAVMDHRRSTPHH
jgi:uncharacterized YccA/Bax inhibitor family protein